MRKRVIVLVLTTFLLCAPALAGHMVAGGGWCDCGTIPGCICDPGEIPIDSQISQPGKSQDAPIDLGSGTLIVFAALILLLRYKA